jgi:hypothetical protein
MDSHVQEGQLHHSLSAALAADAVVIEYGSRYPYGITVAYAGTQYSFNAPEVLNLRLSSGARQVSVWECPDGNCGWTLFDVVPGARYRLVDVGRGGLSLLEVERPLMSSAGVARAIVDGAVPRIPYIVSADFPADERNTIDAAMTILAERLLDERVLQVVDEAIDENDCFQVTSRVLRKLGVTVRDALRKQFELLKRRSELPVLRIDAYRSEKTAARAKLETIVLESDGRVSGSFAIEINRNYLSRNSSAEWWAGAIAHEMLHNLGHSHPGVDERSQYGKKWQMLIFEKAIQTNADPRRMGSASFSSCGPVPGSQHSVSVPANAEGYSSVSGLDWGEYAVRASGEVHYSGGFEHNSGAEGDYENSKRTPGGNRFGQLLIRGPDGLIPYRSGLTVWLLKGDTLEFVVADRPGEYGDNRSSFSVTLEQVRK